MRKHYKYLCSNCGTALTIKNAQLWCKFCARVIRFTQAVRLSK